MSCSLPEQIEIHQTKQWNSLSTKPVEYSVYTSDGKRLCSFEEEKSKILHILLKNKRPFKMLLFIDGKRYYFKRPFLFYKNVIRIYDEKNQLLGIVDKKIWSSIKIWNDEEKILYTIKRIPLSKKFNLFKNAEKVGEIIKNFGGILKELFSSTDNYKVIFPKDSNLEEKILIIAANILIDFIYYEKSVDFG